MSYQSRKRRAPVDNDNDVNDTDPVPQSSQMQHLSTTCNSEKSSIDRLADIMSTFINHAQSNKEQVITAKGEVVPVFNPEDANLTADMWCNKVDELREIFRWSENATIYYALTKLHGLASNWYNSLKTVKHTWEEWKEMIKEAFPIHRDFYEMMGKIMNRRKQSNESYTKYYFDMTALLNLCDVTGINAVSCIIGGIDDNIVKIGAKAGNYQTPQQLYQYLSSIQESSDLRSQNKQLYKNKMLARFDKTNHGPRKSSVSTCFKCGKPGHFANKCAAQTSSDSSLSKRCDYCHSAGHFEKDCFKKKNSSGTVA